MVATTSRLPAADRRESILVAAAERFAARGYDATTLDEIAAAAGVTKPILYRHFGSKQDLYLALLARHAGPQSHRVVPSQPVTSPMLPLVKDRYLAPGDRVAGELPTGPLLGEAYFHRDQWPAIVVERGAAK